MTANQLAHVSALFAKAKIAVSQDWLSDSVQFVLRENGANLRPDELHAGVYAQWLDADLSEIPIGTLPANLGSANPPVKTTLNGEHYVQLNSMIDIGSSAYSQYQERTKTANANALVNADNDDEVSGGRPPPWAEKPRRMLSMVLTDGKTKLKGIEHKPILYLNTATVLCGAKLKIKGPVECRRGILLLNNQNIELLGGTVASIAEKNAELKLLARRIGKENQPTNSNNSTANASIVAANSNAIANTAAGVRDRACQQQPQTSSSTVVRTNASSSNASRAPIAPRQHDTGSANRSSCLNAPGNLLRVNARQIAGDQTEDRNMLIFDDDDDEIDEQLLATVDATDADFADVQPSRGVGANRISKRSAGNGEADTRSTAANPAARAVPSAANQRPQPPISQPSSSRGVTGAAAPTIIDLDDSADDALLAMVDAEEPLDFNNDGPVVHLEAKFSSLPRRTVIYGNVSANGTKSAKSTATGANAAANCATSTTSSNTISANVSNAYANRVAQRESRREEPLPTSVTFTTKFVSPELSGGSKSLGRSASAKDLVGSDGIATSKVVLKLKPERRSTALLKVDDTLTAKKQRSMTDYLVSSRQFCFQPPDQVQAEATPSKPALAKKNDCVGIIDLAGDSSDEEGMEMSKITATQPVVAVPSKVPSCFEQMKLKISKKKPGEPNSAAAATTGYVQQCDSQNMSATQRILNKLSTKFRAPEREPSAAKSVATMTSPVMASNSGQATNVSSRADSPVGLEADHFLLEIAGREQDEDGSQSPQLLNFLSCPQPDNSQAATPDDFSYSPYPLTNDELNDECDFEENSSQSAPDLPFSSVPLGDHDEEEELAFPLSANRASPSADEEAMEGSQCLEQNGSNLFEFSPENSQRASYSSGFDFGACLNSNSFAPAATPIQRQSNAPGGYGGTQVIKEFPPFKKSEGFRGQNPTFRLLADSCSGVSFKLDGLDASQMPRVPKRQSTTISTIHELSSSVMIPVGKRFIIKPQILIVLDPLRDQNDVGKPQWSLGVLCDDGTGLMPVLLNSGILARMIGTDADQAFAIKTGSDQQRQNILAAEMERFRRDLINFNALMEVEKLEGPSRPNEQQQYDWTLTNIFEVDDEMYIAGVVKRLATNQ